MCLFTDKSSHIFSENVLKVINIYAKTFYLINLHRLDEQLKANNQPSRNPQ